MSSSKFDSKDYLFHWCKGDDVYECLNNLLNIIRDRYIFGSNKMIKGGYKVVCFTEAPLDQVFAVAIILKVILCGA